MVRLASILVLLTLTLSSWAQSAGDYRSNASTEWGLSTTWQTFDGVSWVPAVVSPSSSSGIITIQSAHTVTVTANQVVDQVIVNGILKVDPSINLGFPGTISGDAITVNGTLDNSGTITQGTSSIIRMTTATGGVATYIARQGSVINNSTASNLFFEAGSTYQHSYSSTAGTIPTALWNVTSTCLIKGTTPSAPAGLAQSFGNITFESGAGSLVLNGLLTTVKGNFSTARSMNVGGTTGYILNVDGDFSITTGAIVIGSTASTGTNSTINVSGSYSHGGGNFFLTNGTGGVTLRVAKNFNWTGGVISRNSGPAAIVFNGTTTQNFQNNGTLNLTNGIDVSVAAGAILSIGNAYYLGGTNSTFTLNSGATLQVGSTDTGGALVSGTTGNLRVTGTRTFSIGSIIVYNGSGQQYLSTGHPTSAGITTVINNAAGVRLVTTPFTLNGDLTLQSGNFDIAGSKSLTLGGVFTPNANGLVADAFSSLTINDGGSTADFGQLKLTGTSVLKDLTIGGTVGRTVKLGADLSVSDSFTQNIGDFQLNGYTLNLQGAIAQIGGTLTSSATSGLNVSNEVGGALPANLVIGGGSINTITMNRVGQTLTTNSTLDINNINLVAGTFTHTGSLQIAANGKISVASGILTNPVTAASTYDVEYYGTDDVNTGAELPVSATILNNLTNLKPATVYLSASATVNGSLILSDGKFDSNGHQLTLNGNFVSNGDSDFSSGGTVFNGTSVLSGTIAPQFGTITVNAAKSLSIDQDLAINIGGNFVMDGTFTPNQSSVIFNKGLAQTISGSGSIAFYTMGIDKDANGVTIQNAVDILGSLSIKTATTLNAGNNLLRLVSTATRTARVNPLPDLATISGSVIVERYLPNGNGTRAYRYLASPVTDTFVSDWQNEIPITGSFTDPSTGTGIVSTNPSLYYYNETLTGVLGDRYVNYPSSGNASAAALTNGVGYALFVRSNGTVTADARGTLFQHQKVIPVTSSGATVDDGWNLIGNPYASPVLWDKVTLSAGVDNAVYTTDNTGLGGGSQYVTYIGGVSVPAGYNGMIESGQGFWIHATANGTLTFDETDKISSTDSVAQIYRAKSDTDLLRLFLDGASGKDEIAVRFSDEATDQFDVNYDALKMYNDKVSLSSRTSEGKDMTINSLAGFDCFKSIPLSLKNVKEGEHVFTFKGMDSFGSDVDLVLRDRVTGDEVDLRTHLAYPFSVAANEIGNITSRFTLEVGKTRIVRTLPVTSQAICFGNSILPVVVSNSQAEMNYKLFFKGESVSDWVSGNGGDVTFNVAAKKLNMGENYFTVLAKNTCVSDSLTSKPMLNKTPEMNITATEDGVICQSGSTIIKASGARVSEHYNWYASATDTHPLQVELKGELTVSNLQQSTFYYVAVSNSIGCETERKKVNVVVNNYENVQLTEKEGTLVSNYATGNKWYFNGIYLENETGNTITVSQTGTYSVKVEIGGCTTQASITGAITGVEAPPALAELTVYPNPTAGDISIAFGNTTGSATISIFDSSGIQVYVSHIDINADTSVSLPLEAQSAGVYFVRVIIGDKVITRKIVKL